MARHEPDGQKDTGSDKRSGTRPVPAGLERLLEMAAVDPDFCRALLDRRGELTAVFGVHLTPTERKTLALIDKETLRKTIRAMRRQTQELDRDRREFLSTAAKVALAVLGVLSPQDLANAIALGNWAAVEQTPGVGKKIAQRIVAELKDEAPALPVAGLEVPAATNGKAAATGEAAPAQDTAVAEAISALSNLGYLPAQASQAVAAAFKELGDEADTAKLIRRGLKELSA